MAKKDKKDDSNCEDDPVLEIRKKFGDGAIIRGETIVKNIKAISSGSPKLDIALGIGGFPRGRICEIFGAEGSGKTTLALETIAQAQQAGGVAAFIDVEHALDFGYAQDIGVDVDDMMISQPDSGEQALQIAEILCKSNRVDVVVVDSVAALVPQAELDGEIGDAHVAGQARLMSQSLRKMKGIVNKSNTVLIFINQIREKVGVFFGSPESTPGGRALKFYASVRVDLRRVSSMEEGKKESDKVKVGNRVRANVIKNKVAPPFRKCEFEIYFGKGISRAADIIDLSVECEFLKKSGTWYSYGNDRIGNGKAAAIEFLENNAKLQQELREMVMDVKLPVRRRKEDDDTCASV
jgi:recombination protein RecA